MFLRRPDQRDIIPGLLFLLPNIVGFLLFTAGPVVVSFLLSFSSWDLLTPPHWAGLANFRGLLGFHGSPEGVRANDPAFWKYLGNTFFMLLALPFHMAGSLGLAMILNRKIRFASLYRLVFFLPSILAGVAIYYLWRWMYNPEFGLVNGVLALFRVAGPHWLADPRWAKPALMLMGMWMSVGGTSMILYLAALQNVPQELYEAASIDGANRWQQFRVVTFPSVAPVTFFILTMGIIGGLQSGFDSAYIMTGGGPFGATTTISYYIYTKAYVLFQMGYAAAIGWILFLIALAITLLNWKRGGQQIA